MTIEEKVISLRDALSYAVPMLSDTYHSNMHLPYGSMISILGSNCK